jgi:hypothetical protein
MEYFYNILFLSSNSFIFVEMISFSMGDLTLAALFRMMILLIESLPILLDALSTPFAYSHNVLLYNRFLFYMVMEDSFMFIVIRRGSPILHYIILVYCPLFMLCYLTNREIFNTFIVKITASNYSQQTAQSII